MLKENKMPYVQVGAVSSDRGDFSCLESSFLSICVRHFPPSGKLEQMLRLIDPTNEMAVAEVIHTSQELQMYLYYMAEIDGWIWG